MIEKYMEVPYVEGGRDLNGLDCWGLVRLVRMELGKPELPLYSDVDPLDKRGLTKSKNDCVATCNLVEVSDIEGAIATAWRGKVCYHVGIVIVADGRKWILETDVKTGVCLTPIDRFKMKYLKVVFYD